MMLSGRPNKHAVNIIDRPIPKTRAEVPTVSFSAYAYLFSELISYATDRAASITELEERCARMRALSCRPRGGGAAVPRVTAAVASSGVTRHAPQRTSTKHQPLATLPRLDKVGYEVGTRMLELLSYREKQVGAVAPLADAGWLRS